MSANLVPAEDPDREHTEDEKLALDMLRDMAAVVPFFLCEPDVTDGVWNTTGGHGGTGYWIMPEWEKSPVDPTVIDRWEPGQAICAVMGHGLDGVDVDPRSGGDDSFAKMVSGGLVPVVIMKQATVSGGFHLFVASMGVRSLDKVYPGVDVKAGVGGEGHGFMFMAPTRKLSKVTETVESYRIVEPLTEDDKALLEFGALLGHDPLAQVINDRHSPKSTRSAASDSLPYAALTDYQRSVVDAENAALVASWRDKLLDAADWPEGKTDEWGRGWERLSRDAAWSFAKRAACQWSGWTYEDAGELLESITPDEMRDDPQCSGKWYPGIIGKAAEGPLAEPPWPDFERQKPRPVVDVTNQADALEWLVGNLGLGELSGLFLRDGQIVHTPLMGEEGYIAPRHEADDEGPAQVRPMDPLELAARIDRTHSVVKQVKDKKGNPHTVKTLFPREPVARAHAVAYSLPSVRVLLSVSHTPTVRADGTVLAVPGYCQQSRLLYLPDSGLVVPPVSDDPTADEVRAAGDLLMGLLVDFPFATVHDRANYLGALLTPLLRSMVPPPYQMVAIGAPQRGSGKSLLAKMLRHIHGGVLRSEFPQHEEEVRKVLTATLSSTTGAVVQFDNVTGVLKSGTFDGLLTSRVDSDRVLGRNDKTVNLLNDRLWVVTGNNVSISGDLERRTLWVTINAEMERPEERSDFAIPHLERYVQQHRGEILHALLTLIRSWVVAGRPVGPQAKSDDYGVWLAALNGILSNAQLGDTVGVVGHRDSVRADADPEADEWATFLSAAHQVFGEEPWTVGELLGKVSQFTAEGEEGSGDYLPVSVLPGDVSSKFIRDPHSAGRTLGMWLHHRDKRWAGGHSVRRSTVHARNGARWYITKANSSGD